MSRVITDEKMTYNACPDCHRKVQDEPAGYRCEHCNKIHMTMVPTYMLTAKVSDLSGSLYVQFPRELGEPIMAGLNAKEFLELKERLDEGELRTFLNEKVYNQYHQMLIKASADTFGGEGRYRFYAFKVYGHSLREEDSMLLKRLSIFQNKESEADAYME